jgi:hypothetical protein
VTTKARAGLLPLYLKLYDEDGVLVIENDDGGEGTNARLVDFPVTASGTYYIHHGSY